MSNKLHKEKPQIKSKRISVFRIILLVFLIIVFTCILLDIFTTTIRFDKKLDAIVEGKDYYIEEITITKKAYDSYYSTPESSVETTNYFFYYDDSFQKKLFVDGDTYNEYVVGDKVSAYTMDHSNYVFKKEGLLGKEFSNNEIKKGIGGFLGSCILLLCILIWADSKK